MEDSVHFLTFVESFFHSSRTFIILPVLKAKLTVIYTFSQCVVKGCQLQRKFVDKTY
jgi:hypothetical protein